MVYSNRFVMCALVDDAPLNELANGSVQLPFGSEYTLRFRNKNDRRAVVEIYIDGENVSGGGYIVPANSFIDIRRHSNKDSAFKFVSLESGEAIEYGKNGPNADKTKGTIEARFYLEKEKVYNILPCVQYQHHHHYYKKPVYRRPHTYGPSFTVGYSNDGSTGSTMDSCPVESPQYLCSNLPTNSAKGMSSGIIRNAEVKDGCTVEGSMTGQSFYSVSFNREDSFTSIKLFLQGYEKPVETVKQLFVDQDQDLSKQNEDLKRQLALLEENKKLREQIEALTKK